MEVASVTDFDDHESLFGSALPPAMVSLTPFAAAISPSPRRISSCFSQPSKPVRAKRRLAWVSLQGRLVGAEEATSAKTIDKHGVFSVKEAETWELFSPIQRVLIVAVVATAAMNSRKNKQILKLQQSVELRDQVLLGMQQKLDSLCEQVCYFKDQPEIVTTSDASITKRMDCGFKLNQHPNVHSNDSFVKASTKGLNGDDVFKYKMPLLSEAEPEERRMSDLSDWAPSVTSSVDVQLDTLAYEHDINSLHKECEGKDAIIKELSTLLRSAEAFGSKRTAELEDMICRKNMIINKLRKDIQILEQKVMSLTRLRRPSFSAPGPNVMPLPVMADNVLYDMDSTTGPSSSDSDSSSPKNQNQAPAFKTQEISVQTNEKASSEELKNNQFKLSTHIGQQHQKPQTTSPLKEKSLNQTPNSLPALKLKHNTSANGENRSGRRPPTKLKEVAAAQKRLV